MKVKSNKNVILREINNKKNYSQHAYLSRKNKKQLDKTYVMEKI